MRRAIRSSEELRVRGTAAASRLADLLGRLGLGGMTRRARLLLARMTGDELVVEALGARIAGSYTNHYKYLLELVHGGPHPYELELFLERVRPGMSVLDVGAHIGVYTTLAALRVGEGGRVVAVEPDPRNVALLRRNLELNRVAGRVEVIEAVASDSTGEVSFFLDEGQATGTMGTRWRDPRAATRQVELPCVRLDEILAGRGPGLIKIDVEGGEPAALRGMRETLERSPPEAVFVELNPAALERAGASDDELLGLLRELGLGLRLIDEDQRRLVPHDGDGSGSLATRNLICVRE